ncbi:MAG: AbrB/MazE/SpoVT family DNA-binding domain-containing protein [Candidatus Omnitrophica bacterium]|nr:AbrB/MazE/SpoVT family DNA-binding domain-containing protein [Candidatus Omnitrophota bacterium]
MNKDLNKKIFGSVNVGERGQVVIPADIRKSLNIKAGDKLIVISKPNMISLIPTDTFDEFLTQATELSKKIKK